MPLVMCSDKIQGNVEEFDQFLFLIGSIKNYMYMYVFRVFRPYFCYALNILLWNFDKYTEKKNWENVCKVLKIQSKIPNISQSET